MTKKLKKDVKNKEEAVKKNVKKEDVKCEDKKGKKGKKGVFPGTRGVHRVAGTVFIVPDEYKGDIEKHLFDLNNSMEELRVETLSFITKGNSCAAKRARKNAKDVAQTSKLLFRKVQEAKKNIQKHVPES